MSGAPRDPHASPTAPPWADAARTGAVHPVPKTFRSKERQS